jgi:nitric oxide reductase subunit B
MTTVSQNKIFFPSDKPAQAFLLLAMSYLLAGLIFGLLSGFQYILPSFLKNQLAFQKTRPLHVYLVLTWIFTAAQAGIYYYLPRVSNHRLFWQKGAWLHFILQTITSLIIIISFFLGKFGGREYLEFPPWLGACIILSWIPFTINFFATLRPDFLKAPVYYWSWSTGIVFFFITMGESYLWTFDFFHTNIVRDITVQWKALGSMVGSWNMLVYGTGMYIMEKMSGDTKPNRSPLAFFFYFLGLTNLMFNWGHHTYIVPAAPWVKTVAYVISMTELLILGYMILQWKKTLGFAKKNYHLIPYRLLSFTDAWIFLNLSLAIIISVPAWNYYTHGTHITVAHAMGTTIGINTMLMFASVYYILQKENPPGLEKRKKWIGRTILIANISLLFFWISLLGSGMVKLAGKINNRSFYEIMQNSQPWFKVFAYSGIVILLSLATLIVIAFRISRKPDIKSPVSASK